MGGRSNDPGIPAVLYTALEKETAAAEVERGLRLRGINPQAFGPEDWWIYELRVDLDSALDLTEPGVLANLKVSPASLLGEGPADTREIGKQAREAGCQGILVPSVAAPGSANLVIFLDSDMSHPVQVHSSAPFDFSKKR
jgi:RES domain-containing protein